MGTVSASTQLEISVIEADGKTQGLVTFPPAMQQTVVPVTDVTLSAEDFREVVKAMGGTQGLCVLRIAEAKEKKP